MVLKPNVELHIDELVIHGIGASDRGRIGEAVERELARLLSERGLPMGFCGDHIDRLDGGRITISSGGSGEGIGIQIARSLYGFLHAKGSNDPGNPTPRGER